MYSVKKNVLIVAASLKAYGIEHVVLSPGSRNTPLIHTFTQDRYFHCYNLVDERSAAFFALGLIQKLRRPVAICCTSGTAFLNYAPAVAEAYYQQLPLIVISADRSAAWIGQMDGQTLPQANSFDRFVKQSVQLPEVNTADEQWYCQRLVHEALLESTLRKLGPVHINVPLSEPLFDFSASELPQVQAIQRWLPNQHGQYQGLYGTLGQFKRCMIVLGQLPQQNGIAEQLIQLTQRFHCVIIAEHLANVPSSLCIGNFDLVLASLSEAELPRFAPDLLISVGGHLVSKRLKQYLRQYKPQAHWFVSANGELVDLFQSVTDLIEADAKTFLSNLVSLASAAEHNIAYYQQWQQRSQQVSLDLSQQPFSDYGVVGQVLRQLPAKSALHLANSSSVRNAQLFPLPANVDVFCNRGTSGIDGSLSTAVGFSVLNDNLTLLLIGDLSFFYDINILSTHYCGKNLRILLINNGGGGIFHLLPGMEKSPALSQYIAAQHSMVAKNWALAAGLDYLCADDSATLQHNLRLFTDPRADKAILFEVFTSLETSSSAYKEMINNLKNRHYDQD